ncbi:hypothetical protein ANANG_G00267650 [Anguilla anguilla]|uniref:Lysine-rich coiled-coil protein 1 n=1 Tax=Anguilla anguilla TaxID=7936 RepID=A0A9D3RLP1_ANGAN|nr:hypothetical protein ANANG_G00267650 [Anguilla anguilla]
MEPESASVPLLGEAHFENSQISALESASVPDADTVKNTHNTYKTQSEAPVSSSDVLKSLLGSDFCHICGAVLQFESQRVSHYEGKKHAQKVRLYLQTKRHEEGMNSELTVFQQKDGSVDRDRFCQLCNMVFSAPVVAKSHYEGKVHAKNLRKLGIHPTAPATPQSGDPAPQGSPLAPSSQEEGEKEEKEEVEEDEAAGGAPAEGVDLSDPGSTAACARPPSTTRSWPGSTTAAASTSATRPAARALQQLAEQGRPGAHLASLTFCCPVCNKTFCSVEMYQAHMQGNKHQQKEMKVADMMCKSQRKVYDSFQDELADYIQVQKARGLEPRTQRAAERGEGREEEEEGGNEGEAEEREGPREEGEAFGGLAGPALGVAAPPPRSFTPFLVPAVSPPAPGRASGPGLPRARPGAWLPAMAPPFMAAGAGRARGAGRTDGERAATAGRPGEATATAGQPRAIQLLLLLLLLFLSYSSSSSTSSSSSSDGHSRRERRRKRVRKERGKRARDQDSEEDEKRRERRARPQGRKSRRNAGAGRRFDRRPGDRRAGGRVGGRRPDPRAEPAFPFSAVRREVKPGAELTRDRTVR